MKKNKETKDRLKSKNAIVNYCIEDNDGKYVATYRDPGYTIRTARAMKDAKAVVLVRHEITEIEIWRRTDEK